MIEINEKNIKLWSLIGQRATFGTIMLQLAHSNENLMILTSDVSTSAGLDKFRKNFPLKYIDVGIAEQNLIGIATGIASLNFKVFQLFLAQVQTVQLYITMHQKRQIKFLKKEIFI